VVALLLLSTALLTQTPASVRRAAQTISPGDIRRRIGVIADDSMRGRDTPSPELDKVAQYIAREYGRLGLKPGGDRGTFIQRYSLDRVKIVAESSAAFVHGGPGGGATFKYATDFVFADNMFESGDYAGDLVLVAGPLRTATADTAAVAGKMVLLVGGRPRGPDRERVLGWKPAGVILVTGAPDSSLTRPVTAAVVTPWPAAERTAPRLAGETGGRGKGRARTNCRDAESGSRQRSARLIYK